MSSEINIWWNKSQPSWISACFLPVLNTIHGPKHQAAQLATIHLSLNHIPEILSWVQVWRLGWRSSIHTLTDLAALHGALSCLKKKTILIIWEHFQSRRKQVFFEDNLVHGLGHASFTKTDHPNSSLAEAPPDLHQSAIKFHSRCETLWLCRPPQVFA